MTGRRMQMIEDRHVRDAARVLVEVDLQNLRTNLSLKGIGERAVDRITQGASDVFEEARDIATDNKGILAAIIAALVLWFARDPIRERLMSEDE